jgi:hypothetical protein
MLLVASREDVGALGLSNQRLDKFVRDNEFSGYYRTSAKEGWGIAELSTAIRKAIDWQALPAGSSTSEFSEIKHFLIQEKQGGHLLSSVTDLYHRYEAGHTSRAGSREQGRRAFETCIGLLESRDLIHRLSFGNLVLLQPELLDVYAADIVNAAKSEPDGLGCISEEEARTGRFKMAESDRMKDSDAERLLLIATVEELLRHEIALSEAGFLIFPSQLTKERPYRSDRLESEVMFRFDGPILNIYATLVVRLSHSGVFERRSMWQNGVEFSVRGGLGVCGILLNYIQEGRAELSLVFDAAATVQSRYHLDDYVSAHLARRALPGSISRARIFRCPACNEEVSPGQATRRRQLGHSTLRCPVCEHEVSILEWTEKMLDIQATSLIPQIDISADSQRDRSTIETALHGKRALGEFDVFLSYHSVDRESVKRIGERLKARGILPWLDEWELQPGMPWQSELEKVIENIRAAAVFVGPAGIGPWQEQEIQACLRKFVNSNRPVIPVLLPYPPGRRGAIRSRGTPIREVDTEDLAVFPKLPMFLENRTWVDFRKSDPDPLDSLVWGIVGRSSQPPR